MLVYKHALSRPVPPVRGPVGETHNRGILETYIFWKSNLLGADQLTFGGGGLWVFCEKIVCFALDDETKKFVSCHERKKKFVFDNILNNINA